MGRIEKKAHHVESRVHQEVIMVVLLGHHVSPAWALAAAWRGWHFCKYRRHNYWTEELVGWGGCLALQKPRLLNWVIVITWYRGEGDEEEGREIMTRAEFRCLWDIGWRYTIGRRNNINDKYKLMWHCSQHFIYIDPSSFYTKETKAQRGKVTHTCLHGWHEVWLQPSCSKAMFYQGLLEVIEPFYVGDVIFRLFLMKTILSAMRKNMLHRQCWKEMCFFT